MGTGNYLAQPSFQSGVQSSQVGWAPVVPVFSFLFSFSSFPFSERNILKGGTGTQAWATAGRSAGRPIRTGHCLVFLTVWDTVFAYRARVCDCVRAYACVLLLFQIPLPDRQRLPSAHQQRRGRRGGDARSARWAGWAFSGRSLWISYISLLFPSYTTLFSLTRSRRQIRYAVHVS